MVFCGVCWTLNVLMSPWIFSVFWPISTMLSSGWSLSLISTFCGAFINPLMIAPSTIITMTITVSFIFNCFISSLADVGSYLSFHFLLILLCGLPGWQSPLYGGFSIWCWLLLYLVFSRELVICIFFEIPPDFILISQNISQRLRLETLVGICIIWSIHTL